MEVIYKSSTFPAILAVTATQQWTPYLNGYQQKFVSGYCNISDRQEGLPVSFDQGQLAVLF